MVSLTSPASPKREIEILATNDIPSRQVGREGKMDVLITYRVGPMQTGTVMIPKEDLTEAKVKEAVQKDVEAKTKLIGLKFQV